MNPEPVYTTLDDSPLCGDLHGMADLLTWQDAIDLERWFNARAWIPEEAYDCHGQPIFTPFLYSRKGSR
jgi:hypothetical protein